MCQHKLCVIRPSSARAVYVPILHPQTPGNWNSLPNFAYNLARCFGCAYDHLQLHTQHHTMKRPLPVTILGCLFIVAGSVGLGYHLTDRPFDHWTALISFVRILAIVGGAFLLTGRNWARWLTIAWLAFHVVVSAFHSFEQEITHLVLLIVVAYFLFTPSASRYFRAVPSP